ncbi:MAG: Gldg family protein [bacterium]
MAIEGTREHPRWLFPALACTLPYLAGMALIFVAERLVETPAAARSALDGAGAAAILWAILARFVNWARSRGDRASVEGKILAAYLAGVLSLLLYAAQLEPVGKKLMVLAGLDSLPLDRARTALRVVWPIVWASAIFPLLFMEASYASMARASRIERRRVSFSAASGMAIAWLAASLFLINYVAQSYNRKWDLSFDGTSSPSEGARRLVSNLTDTFQVIAFYPEVNEVREALFSYFDDLRGGSGHFQIRAYDQVLEPKIAKELGVNQNGAVVFRFGDKKEVARVGLSLAEARAQLSKLDRTFQEKFLQLVSAKKVAYFVAGHGERSFEEYGSKEKDSRAALKGLKSILRGQNFEVKVLGLGQGLAMEAPEDASVILVIDPTEDFLPEELNALRRYLNRGGRLWVALDPDHSTNLAGLLAEYGVRFVAAPLANESYYVRAFYNKADRYNLYTNRSSSHASVSTLSRNSSRLAVVMMKTGSLEKAEGSASPARVVMTLRSMAMTWSDADRNMDLDPPGEEKKVFDLAAAVSMPVGGADQAGGGKAEAQQQGAAAAPGDQSPAQEQEAKDAEKTDGKPEMRMIVLADADALSDQVIGNLGNYHLFDEGLKWLFEGEKLLGDVSSEQDVRILHTREQDVWRFYGTIFAVPLVVLGVGVGYNRLRARSRRGRTG